MTSSAETSAAKPRIDFVDFSIATVAGLALAFTTLFLCVVPLIGNITGSRDFVVFWATGQQLVHHANPYDAAAMKQIEHAAGLNTGYNVLFMRNPPWALPLALPLGLLGLRVGAFLWSITIVACLVVSVLMLWRMQGRPPNHLHWLGLSFGPALVCAMMGQTTLFSLLGYVLFLDLHRKRPFLAGASLWLCLLKPHLFIPFGVVLLLWILVFRRYKVLAGVLVALGASCSVVYLLDPTAWADYAQMMHTNLQEQEYIPCLVVVLRRWLRPHSVWLQYLAPALGSVWALIYFWPRRHAWEWERYGNPLVLVSLVAAPYSWVYDGGLAIPALLQGAYLTRSRILLAILAVASISIEVELVCGVKITSALYLWTVPGWFAWYLLAQATSKEREPKVLVAGEESQ
jgi:hypothetical protein